MTKLMPYLLFDGKCKPAMEFYHSVLGGKLNMTQVKDTPARTQMQPFQQEKILNAYLEAGALQISASDWLALDVHPNPGNTVGIFLSGGTEPVLRVYFDKLAVGGKITSPLQKTFFGVFGSLVDQFGVPWKFAGNYGESS